MSTGKMILLGGRSESTNIVYHALEQSFGVERVLIEEPVDRKKFLQRRAKRLGPTMVGGQVLFRLIAVPLLQRWSRERIDQIKGHYELKDDPIPHERVEYVTSVNSDYTIHRLQEIQPEVVVINGTRIVAKRVLEAVPCPFLNTHAGITPKYRGVYGGYWARVQGEPGLLGTSVHVVDPGIDTGGVVEQIPVEPTSRDNVITYPYLQLGSALPPLKRAVAAALNGTLTTVSPLTDESILWSHPTLWSYLKQGARSGVW